MRTIINDLPTAADALDFEPYASALVKIIASESTETPLTIGVFGQWGAGKTSLMRMCERKLDERTAPLTVWFNAWKYEREGAVWRAMLVAVLNGLREVTISGKKRSQDYEDLLDGIEATLFTPGTPDADLGTVVLPEGKAPRVTLNLTPALASALPDLTGALEAGDVPEALDAVRRAQRRLYRQHVADLDRFQTRLEEALNLAGRRLVLIVDDLDRCLPENAVEVLEAVKLYLDVPGVVVMLGLDQLVLARGIEIRYRELGLLDAGTSDERRKRFVIEGTNYLEKIIQLPFQIPDIDPYRMGDFVRGLADRWADGVPEVFARGLGENPRRVKRTVNSFLLLSALADERRQGQIQQILLAKLVALQHVAHDLYELLKVSPRYLVELETHFARQSERPDSEQAGVPSGDGAMAEPDVSPALRPYLVRRPVQRILTLFVTGDDQRDHARFSLLSTEQLRTYFTLTRQSEALSISSGDKTFIEPRTVPVPAGKFVMGTTDEQLAAFASEGQDEQWFAYESPQHSVELSAYRIGKYPVTNAEYRSFIDETSHPAPHDWDNGNYP
ncbi:MAG: P-loop NTPase fold protein, partial [Bacteroidota bacterium]